MSLLSSYVSEENLDPTNLGKNGGKMAVCETDCTAPANGITICEFCREDSRI